MYGGRKIAIDYDTDGIDRNVGRVLWGAWWCDGIYSCGRATADCDMADTGEWGIMLCNSPERTFGGADRAADAAAAAAADAAEAAGACANDGAGTAGGNPVMSYPYQAEAESVA